MNTKPLTSPLELFRRLTIPELEARRKTLAEEDQALRTLLRALKAQERARRRHLRSPTVATEGAHE